MFNILSVRTWLLDPEFVSRYEKFVLNRLNSGDNTSGIIAHLKEELEIPRTSFGLVFDEELETHIFETEKNRIANIPLQGVMTKYGGLCTLGTADLAAKIHGANLRDDIDGIVLTVRTPGGAADSVEIISDAINSSKKPVVSWVDGIAASGGMWVISQTDFIYTDSAKISSIGSIGALMAHVDETGYHEKEGFKVTIIRAEQSRHKALINSSEPLKENVRKAIEAELTELTDYFIDTVKEGRGEKLQTGKENVFSGKMYSGEMAVNLGLVDAIGSIDDAIRKVEELSKGKKKEKLIFPSNTNTKNFADMNFKFLNNLFGKPEELKEPTTQEEAAELEAKIEEKVTEMRKELSEAQEKITYLSELKVKIEDKIKVQEELISGKDKIIEDLNKRIEEGPAYRPTKIVTDVDSGYEFKDENQDLIDNLPHNRNIADNPLFNK